MPDRIDNVDPGSIRCCVDRPLPAEMLVEAASVAARENPSNVPSAMAMVAYHPDLPIDPAHMALLADRRWAPGRELRVRFLGGTSAQRSTLMRFADEWSRYASITFRRVVRGQAEIRADFQRGQGSWSYMGTDSLLIDQSQPTLNIGWEPDAAVCLHELGHALGCVHEHQLPTGGIPWDRERAYWWYQRTQGWSREMVDSNVFAVYDARQLTNGFMYDPKSIMHYSTDAYLLTDPSRATGWNATLSKGDKSYIGLIYPQYAGSRSA